VRSLGEFTVQQSGDSPVTPVDNEADYQLSDRTDGFITWLLSWHTNMVKLVNLAARHRSLFCVVTISPDDYTLSCNIAGAHNF
jgi:hypothetical protein